MPDSNDVIRRLDTTDTLLDVMIQVEDYLDSLDLYVFKNFIDGEIVEGPYVERYWVKLTLKYPYREMPDPSGGLRLLKYGSKVSYERATEKVPTKVKSPEDIDPATNEPIEKEEPIWLVHVKIPRRFIEDLDVEGLDLYNEDSNKPDMTANAAAEAENPETEVAPDSAAPATEFNAAEESGGEMEI